MSQNTDNLSEAERQARLEANRAELKKLLDEKAKRDGTASSEQRSSQGLNLAAATWQPPQQPQRHANLANTIFNDGYDDDEDDWGDDDFDPYGEDDWDDDFDEDLEAFEDELEQEGVAATKQETDKVYTEFEPFKMAKLGNLEELRNYEAQEGVPLKSLEDNFKRTLLHFAADCGSIILIKYLMERCGLTVTKDEKGMTPYDVATINGHESCAKEILSRAPAGVIDTTGGIERFLPKPASMSISKAQPAVPQLARARQFWSKQAPAAPANPNGLIFTVMPGSTDFPTGPCYDLYAHLTSEQHLDSWLIPFSQSELAKLGEMTPHVLGGDANQSLQGMMSVILLNQIINKKATMGPCSLLGNLWCNNTIAEMKSAMASGLLYKAYELLKAENHQAGFFKSKEKLPVVPLATVKYFRRCVEPKTIFKIKAVCENVFPTFYSNDAEMRCDSILKGKLWGIDHSSKWVQINMGNQAEAEAGAPIMCEMLNGVGNLELDLYPNWDPNTYLIAFGRPGMSTFVLKDGNGTVTDAMVFRTRRAKADKKVVASTLVASAFTTLKGETRLFHAAQVARSHLSAHVVYTTNTYGITEKDCRLSFFEEVKGAAEYVYAAANPAAPAMGALPSAKIGIPFGLF